MSDLITPLKKLQSDLNIAVDEAIANASKTGPAGAETAVSLNAIRAAAARLTDVVTPPSMINAHVAFLPLRLLTIQIGLEMGIFDNITSHTSLAVLAESTATDPRLLFRLVRTLTAQGYFVRERNGTYSSTPLSQDLLNPAMRAWVAYQAQLWTVHKALLPFLKQEKWRNPDDPTHTAMHHAIGKSFWDDLKSDPVRRAQFDDAMKVQDNFPSLAIPTFDFMSEVPVEHAAGTTTAVTVVDVGGGYGQVLELIRRAHPYMMGRLVLQDLPEVISKVDTAKLATLHIETQSYDFFTPQPIEGAKYYYLRKILHDWPDSSCIKILGRVHDAMISTPDHSRLLLQESILPDFDVNLSETLQDMLMMEIFSGQERSESQWKELLAAAGLKIIKIHRAKLGTLGIIEAQVDIPRNKI